MLDKFDKKTRQLKLIDTRNTPFEDPEKWFMYCWELPREDFFYKFSKFSDMDKLFISRFCYSVK